MDKSKVVFFDSLSLLNVRIVCLFSALVHLTVTAVVTLNIDTTVDEDPRIKAYSSNLKWKLITCWFNLITLVYLPLRLYGDWRNKQGEGNSHLVMSLYRISDLLMTGILFPVTMYSGLVFWYVYINDPSLLAPPKLFNYLPYWAQHSLHTVSMVVVLVDLVITPRRRPATLKPRFALLMAFSWTYFAVVCISYSRGEIIYAVFEKMDLPQFVLTYTLSLALVVILFTIQWLLIDLIHGTNQKNKDI